MMEQSPPNTMSIRVGLPILALLMATSLAAQEAKKATLPPAAKGKVDYIKQIRPILRSRCITCHGPKKQESGLRVDNRKSLLQGGESEKPAIRIGKSSSSNLIHLVAGVDPDHVMPPEGKRLTAKQIGLLRAWIDQGAKGLSSAAKRTTNHWSFQPIRRPKVPRINDQRIRTAIDAFVLRKLQSKSLKFAADANRWEWIRRLYLDLLGVLPTPNEVRDFQSDSRPDAYERLVDTVLSSPRYGERWASHWLDIVRFADTNGFETNTPRPNAYHYRDYVIRSFNSDRPYDQFVTDQLAGDSTGHGAATGFLVAGAYDRVKSPDINLTLMQRQDELADMINTASTAFLAMTVACARCHNHKFDPILQTDFYGMQAVFAGVQHGNRRIPRKIDPGFEKRKLRIAAEITLQQGLLRQLTKPLPKQTCLIIDDQESLQTGQFVHLSKPKSTVVYPAGSKPGQRNDKGRAGRLPNIGRGGYTYWTQPAGTNLASYRPQLVGDHRIWLSWGCHEVHSDKVKYILDHDGDLKTTADQKLIATIDQRRPTGSKTISKSARFSHLHDAGLHSLTATTQLIIRAADARPTTAELVVFQKLSKPGATTLPLVGSSISSKTNEERFSPVEAKHIRFVIHATNSAEPCIDELEVFRANSKTNVALAKLGTTTTSSGDFPNNALHKLKHINDGIHGNSKSWISNQNGKGWVQLTLKTPQVIDRIRWGRDKQARYKDRTATVYHIQVGTTDGNWRTVASSTDHFAMGTDAASERIARFNALPQPLIKAAVAQAKSLDELESEQQKNAAQQGNFAYAGTFVQPAATHRLHRGDPLQKREQVVPNAISILGELGLRSSAKEMDRRMALAKWITSQSNPLSARVIANRVWQHHFGTGIVRTPSDFGGNGARPTHPELLDYLASELRDSNWSLKQLHRQIVLSTAYRQSSTPRKRALAIDASSALLWRFPPRRLSAEVIRDNILQVTGALDLSMYGPGYSVFNPNTNYVRVYTPRDKWGPTEWRRMVYMHKVRMERDDVFGGFDCPDAGQPTARRSRSTTALQALSLLNSQFILQQSKLFAERLQRDAGKSKQRQIRRAFSLSFGRSPTQVEAAAALVLVNKHGLTALCRALLNSNELLFLP